MLERAGIDPSQAGRIFNRAAPGAAPTVDDATDVAIPTDQAQLQAMLTDQATMAKLFAKPEAFTQFVTNYARAVHNRDLSIAAQVQEQVQIVMAEMIKAGELEGAGGIRRPDLRGAGEPGNTIGSRAVDAKHALYSPKAMGAALDREFTDSASYFKTIWHQGGHTAENQAKLQRIRNAFSSTVPSEGGFLIPETLRSELLRVSLETSVVRPRARVIPMETLRVPFPAIDSTTNVGSVYGGIVGYWTEEGAAYTEVPNELMSDSISSFQAFLDQIFPEALGFYEDDAFINGNGVGMPLGFVSSGNLANVSVAKESLQATATIVWENIVKMYARMLPSSLGRAVWIASIDTFPALALMALAVGTGGSAIWLNNGVVGPPMTILGRPVIFTEKTPVLGTVGDINFVDLSYYLIGDRQVMSAMSSPHFKFQNDQTAYRIIERVDGRPWLMQPITPRNNASATLSAFVQLATR
jgi:HK97 family phage major capsid protein